MSGFCAIYTVLYCTRKCTRAYYVASALPAITGTILFCEDSDLFGSVRRRRFLMRLLTMFSGPVCHMWPTERKYIFCAMPQGRWRHFLPHHYSEPIIHRVVRPLLSLMKPLRHSAHLKNKNSTLSLEPHRKNAHLMWLTKIIKKLNAKVANFALKGQCQEIFGTLFIKKNYHCQLGPIWTNGFAIFFIFEKIFAKNVCPRSQRLCGHRVSVVKNYADIVSE